MSRKDKPPTVVLLKLCISFLKQRDKIIMYGDLFYNFTILMNELEILLFATSAISFPASART